MGAALEAWLRTHEAEESRLDGYRGYLRRTIEPALGSVPLSPFNLTSALLRALAPAVMAAPGQRFDLRRTAFGRGTERPPDQSPGARRPG